VLIARLFLFCTFFADSSLGYLARSAVLHHFAAFSSVTAFATPELHNTYRPISGRSSSSNPWCAACLRRPRTAPVLQMQVDLRS
jgi:hypothetical protein